MKVDKTQFEEAIKALLKAPPTPLENLKGKGRTKTADPLKDRTQAKGKEK